MFINKNIIWILFFSKNLNKHDLITCNWTIYEIDAHWWKCLMHIYGIDANSYRCYIVSSSFMIVVELAINGKALMCRV